MLNKYTVKACNKKVIVKIIKKIIIYNGLINS